MLCAQPYGNEWIDYKSDYQKIEIWEDALYYMDYATLVANGMTGTIIGSDLKLINKGAEIALHVSEEGIWDGELLHSKSVVKVTN